MILELAVIQSVDLQRAVASRVVLIEEIVRALPRPLLADRSPEMEPKRRANQARRAEQLRRHK